MRSDRKTGWFSLLGLLLTLAIVIISPVVAAPILPHTFYGNVTMGSQPAPVNTHITATVTGGGGDMVTTIAGEYGIHDFNTLEVQPSGEDASISGGAPISFFINGVRADVREGGKSTWMTSYPFASGGDTNLDLRVGGTVPTTVPTTAPTTVPTTAPTTAPTTVPTSVPTTAPTTVPTTGPTTVPTTAPTTAPTTVPTSVPTTEIPVFPYYISATSGPNGAITPSGTIPVTSGHDQSFTIVPQTGYTINQILVDGNPVARTPVYTFNDVVADHTIAVSFMEGSPGYFTTELGSGWNLFSTPILLGSGHQYLENIFPATSLENIDVILGWNGSAWFIPGYQYELKPLYALYVRADNSATAYLYPSDTITMPPIRSLVKGWNLIGPAPDYQEGGFSARSVEDTLVTVYGDPANPGYLIVISPGVNQPGWSYVRDAMSVDLLPYKGYWVFMENPETLAGFSTTPIS